MGKLRTLTAEEAADRFEWLEHHAGPGLATAEALARLDMGGNYPATDAKVIEALHEIKRVAAEVANYYLSREPRVTWEVHDLREEEPVKQFASESDQGEWDPA